VVRKINDSTKVDHPFTEAEVSQIMDSIDVVYDNFERQWTLAGDMFERWGDE